MEGSKGWVPLMEATPGRFHGPKISQRVIPRATKLSPNPAKISLTPAFVLRNPEIIAQRLPPIIPPKKAKIRVIPGIPIPSPIRRIAVAEIAPATTCPSTPMFQRPIRKLKTKPQAQRVRGIHALKTWATLDQEPRDPINR
jgi:hypothetical protein